METLLILGVAITVGLLFWIVLGAVLLYLERRVIQNRYEWLEFLSHYEWRSALQIRKEMQKLKKTSFGGTIVYLDLAQLQEEGLVERRITTKKIKGFTLTFFDYRMTSSGTRKKLEEFGAKKEKDDIQLHPI